MELTKLDTKMTKGLAILFMVLLHLFCIKTDLPYTPLFYLGNTPLIYYLGLFGDCCVVIYCFCSGYAHCLIYESKPAPYKSILRRLLPFLINFWIICILFSFVGLIARDNGIPESLSAFSGNMFLYKLSYNGAWWFVPTYIIICLFSAPIIKLVKKHTAASVILFFVIYFFCYLIRFNKLNIPTDSCLFFSILKHQAATGTSLLPYVVGAVFYKHKVFSSLSAFTQKTNKHIVNTILIVFMATMLVAHGFVQSLFVAIFTGIGTIICFNLWKKGKFATKLFSFLGTHSTNIWLTHMFFYMAPFNHLVFKAKYSIPSFLFMMVLTILTSFIINGVLKVIYKYTPVKYIK